MKDLSLGAREPTRPRRIRVRMLPSKSWVFWDAGDLGTTFQTNSMRRFSQLARRLLLNKFEPLGDNWSPEVHLPSGETSTFGPFCHILDHLGSLW